MDHVRSAERRRLRQVPFFVTESFSSARRAANIMNPSDSAMLFRAVLYVVFVACCSLIF